MKYNAYAYLVFSDKTLTEVKTEAAAKITESTGTAAEIGYTGDVNKTGKIDVNDAQLVWNIRSIGHNDFRFGKALRYLAVNIIKDHTVMDIAGSHHRFQHKAILITGSMRFIRKLPLVFLLYEQTALLVSNALRCCDEICQGGFFEEVRNTH